VQPPVLLEVEVLRPHKDPNVRCWCRELRSGTAALCATQRRTSRHAGCRAHRDARRHLIRAFQAATVVQCANPARAGDCDRESLTVVNLAMLAASSAVTLAVRPGYDEKF